MTGPHGDTTAVTDLLAAMRAGDAAAADRLLPLLYDQLRASASRLLRREAVGHTLQPTALVHEAWLKLAGTHVVSANDRTHFLCVAARAMRQVLVEHARRRRAAKRGDGRAVESLDEVQVAAEGREDEMLALDDALDRLDAVAPRLRQVVELRFFAGLTEPEIADTLGVTPRTVQRDWVKARAFLHHALALDSA